MSGNRQAIETAEGNGLGSVFAAGNDYTGAMRTFNDKVIAITGAGSGIGRALAKQFALEGGSLALCDVNACGLRETVDQLKSSRLVTASQVDVSDRDAVRSWAADTVEAHEHVDVIINNAGVIAKGSIEEVSYDDLHWVINVNLWGVIHGVKAFLPYLKARPESHIVNVGSVHAFVPYPHSSPYNTAKYGVAGFTETLMQELRGTTTAVTCVHPGGIDTNIVRCARNTTADDMAVFRRIARTSPERAARAIISGMKRKKKRVFVGADAVFLSICHRLFPITTLQAFGTWFAPNPSPDTRNNA